MNTDTFDTLTTIGGILIAVFVAGALIVAGAQAIGFDEPRGESTYTGVVVDFENERGFPFATTQAHLKTDSQSSNSETFCVHPSNRGQQVDVLRDAAQNGNVVTVTYSRPLFVPIWDCEKGTSIIRDIEVREDATPAAAQGQQPGADQ